MDFLQWQPHARIQPPCYWYTLQTPQDLSTIKLPGSSGSEQTNGSSARATEFKKHVRRVSLQASPWPLSRGSNIYQTRSEESVSGPFFSPVKQGQTNEPIVYQVKAQNYSAGLHPNTQSDSRYRTAGIVNGSPFAKLRTAYECLFSRETGDTDHESGWTFQDQSVNDTFSFNASSEVVSFVSDPCCELPLPVLSEGAFPAFNAESTGFQPPRFEVLDDNTDQDQCVESTQVAFNFQECQPLGHHDAPMGTFHEFSARFEGAKICQSDKVFSHSLQDVTNTSRFSYRPLTVIRNGKPTWEPSTPSPQIVRQNNSKIKAHRCLICQKVFKRPSSYRIHFTIHSGEKSFSCFRCGKSFNVKSNLTRHEKLHDRHQGTDVIIREIL